MQINHIQVGPGDNGIRLDKWFKRYYPAVSFTVVAKLARTGQVRLNGGRVKVSDKLATSDELRFPDLARHIHEDTSHITDTPRISEQRLARMAKDLESAIIYMDDDIIVLNKPVGLASQGGTKVHISVDEIAQYWRFGAEWAPRLVHRLDKETSGVMLLARSPQIAATIASAFHDRKVHKSYIAMLAGVPKAKEGVIRAPIGKEKREGVERVQPNAEKSKYAVTEYRVLDYVLNQVTLMEFTPLTGRTHQIRVHSQLLGCPILGDDKYGRRISELTGINQHKLHLHAYRIELQLNGRDLKFTAPPPEFFQNSMNALGFEKL